eukprot:5681147-Pyramimonas_sp.AAC.1
MRSGVYVVVVGVGLARRWMFGVRVVRKSRTIVGVGQVFGVAVVLTFAVVYIRSAVVVVVVIFGVVVCSRRRRCRSGSRRRPLSGSTSSSGGSSCGSSGSSSSSSSR